MEPSLAKAALQHCVCCNPGYSAPAEEGGEEGEGGEEADERDEREERREDEEDDGENLRDEPEP